METLRHRYVIALETRSPQDRPRRDRPGARGLTSLDVGDLPALMLAAYSGTIDDEGESLADAENEIEQWIEAGGSLEHSFACDVDDRIAAAALVSVRGRAALVAYAITHPAHKRRGLATAAVAGALDSLAHAGYTSADLFITAGNVASERLFERLGAIRTPAGETDR